MPLQSGPHLPCQPFLQLLSLCLLALWVGIFYTPLCGLIINTHVLPCADRIACLVVLHLGLFVEHILSCLLRRRSLEVGLLKICISERYLFSCLKAVWLLKNSACIQLQVRASEFSVLLCVFRSCVDSPCIVHLCMSLSVSDTDGCVRDLAKSGQGRAVWWMGCRKHHRWKG